MFGRETRMLLRHYLEQGTSKNAPSVWTKLDAYKPLIDASPCIPALGHPPVRRDRESRLRCVLRSRVSVFVDDDAGREVRRCRRKFSKLAAAAMRECGKEYRQHQPTLNVFEWSPIALHSAVPACASHSGRDPDSFKNRNILR